MIRDLQIQEQKGWRIQIEFPHVILKECHIWWIKCRVTLTFLMLLQHVQNEISVRFISFKDRPRVLIGPTKAQLKP